MCGRYSLITDISELQERFDFDSSGEHADRGDGAHEVDGEEDSLGQWGATSVL